MPGEIQRIEGLSGPQGYSFGDHNTSPDVLKGARYAPNSVAFGDQCGATVVSYGEDGFLRKWDLVSAQEMWRAGDCVPHQYYRAEVSRHGKYIATRGDGKCGRVFDALGQEIRQLRIEDHAGQEVGGLGFSMDERYVFAIFDGRTLAVWDLQTGQEWLPSGTSSMGWLSQGSRRMQPRGDAGDVYCATFSPDGSRILTGEKDAIQLWEFPTGKQLQRFACQSPAYCLAYSPLGNIALVGDNEGAWLLNPMDGQRRKLAGEPCRVYYAAFSPDGRRVMFVSNLPGNSSLRLCEAPSGRELIRLEGHQKWINSVAFSPDGRYALSCSHDATVRLWALPQ